MTFPKFLAIASILLFATIGILAFFKSQKPSPLPTDVKVASVVAPTPIALEREIQIVQPSATKAVKTPAAAERTSGVVASKKVQTVEKPLPEADRILELFNTSEPRLPIVETIVYKSRVPCLGSKAVQPGSQTMQVIMRHHVILLRAVSMAAAII